MKPHLAYINNSIIKKQLAEKAKDQKTSYQKYRATVDMLLEKGIPIPEIITELEDEEARILAKEHEGDPIFQQGVHNAKVACITSIRVIIAELKGDQ